MTVLFGGSKFPMGLLRDSVQYTLLLILAVLTVTQLPNQTYAAVFSLDLATSQPPYLPYDLGAPVIIGGNVTLDGVPVNNALVTFEVRDPRNQLLLVRTCLTGTDPPEWWYVDIIEFYPCDQAGNPLASIAAGDQIGFKMTIRNNMNNSELQLHIAATVSIQWSNGVPFTAFVMYEGKVDSPSEETFFTWGLELPKNAPLGTASIYASVIHGLPSASWGDAHSPESLASIEITQSAPSSQATINSAPLSINDSACRISFATSCHGGAGGQYTVYSAAKRWALYQRTTAVFCVKLVTDITGSNGNPDGKVDILDLALVSAAFGSYPEHPEWKPQADVNNDQRIDIIDIAMVSGDFGKYIVLP